MRFHVHALTALILLLTILAPPPFWWALVALACSGVLAAELMNTAIEHLAGRLHPELHPAIRIVKDCGAAAVLVSSAFAVVVGVAFAVYLWHAH